MSPNILFPKTALGRLRYYSDGDSRNSTVAAANFCHCKVHGCSGKHIFTNAKFCHCYVHCCSSKHRSTDAKLCRCKVRGCSDRHRFTDANFCCCNVHDCSCKHRFVAANMLSEATALLLQLQNRGDGLAETTLSFVATKVAPVSAMPNIFAAANEQM